LADRTHSSDSRAF